MHVFRNGVCEMYWFVAEDVAHAEALMCEFEGPLGLDVDDRHDPKEWMQEPDDKVLAVYLEDQVGDVGPGLVKMSCRSWVRVHGSGFLATNEY